MKLSSMMVFLLILALFVFAIVVTYNTPEGFLSYQNTTPVLNQVTIPQYSVYPVYKMYDSLYFDNMNGNVIELFGEDSGDNSSDMTGNSLTQMILMTRTPQTIGSLNKANATMVDLSFGTILSPMVSTFNIGTSIQSSYIPWIYPLSTDIGVLAATIPNYQVCYLPCGTTDTVVHVHDRENSTQVGTYFFRNNKDPVHLSTIRKVKMPSNYVSDTDKDKTINTYVTNIGGYDNGKMLYQLSDYVFFDTTNGYVVIRDYLQFMTIYDGTGNENGPVKIHTSVDHVTNTPTTIPNRPFQVQYIEDTNPDKTVNHIVLYVTIPNTSKTLIVLLALDPFDSTLLTIKNSVLFNPAMSNGIEGNPNIVLPYNPNNTASNNTASNNAAPNNTASNNAASNNTTSDKDDSQHTIQKKLSSLEDESTDIPSLDEVIADYYTKFYGKNAYAADGSRYSTDFLLKTQIIPPVCPSCPQCPSNVTCTNCGGRGGAGTVNCDGNTLVDISGGSKILPRRSVTDVSANINTAYASTPAPAPAPAPASASASASASATSDGRSTAYADSNDHYTPNYQALDPPVQLVGSSTKSTPVSGPDWYSYYGAIPSKPAGTYVPVTSDFSKFGR